MKKFTLFTFLLAFAFALNVSAQNRKDVKNDNAQVRIKEVRPESKAPKKIELKLVKVIPHKADVPEGQAKVTLTAGDVWGDGSGYQMLLDADHTAYGNEIPISGGLTSSGDASASQYAAFEYKIPANADGAMDTENIILNSSESVIIPAGVYDYAITNPTPEDRIWIASNSGSVPGRYDDYEFESMCEYIFVISEQANGNDGADLTINDPRAAAEPFGVQVTPDATTALVKWRSEASTNTWNLRYRPYVVLKETVWDFNVEDISTQIDGWKIIDADGDGNNWGLAYTDDSQTDYCLSSASWMNGDALTPDNWLITPAITLGTNISFNAWGSDPSYCEEVFGVYVFEGDEWTSIADFTPLSGDLVATGDKEMEYSFDLSAYSGTGYIAIRHYNITDMFRLCIDNVRVIDPDSPVIPDWIYVNGVTENPYTLSGLAPDTEYEVQVQGVRPDTGKESKWTESVRFITENSTGINGLSNDEKNGSKVFYNLAGQRVSGNPPAGLYIQNGKKVIVK